MERTQRKLINTINEHFILPILFLLVNITVVVWFYAVHEYSQSNEIFETHYRFEQSAMESYKGELKFQIILLSIILLVTPFCLKYRRRWLLLVITLMHSAVLYYFFC